MCTWMTDLIKMSILFKTRIAVFSEETEVHVCRSHMGNILYGGALGQLDEQRSHKKLNTLTKKAVCVRHAVMDNGFHPVHDILSKERSAISNRLIHLH